MATIRPTTVGSMATKATNENNDTGWTAVALTCDVIGMTDIPVVSQGAEAVSAVISLCQGDYVSAGLSVASMVPVLGKGAEVAKLARKGVKVVDGVATVGKEAKVVGKVAKNSDEIAKAAAQTNKAEKAAAKAPAPQHMQTNAKNVDRSWKKETLNDRVTKNNNDSIFNPDKTPNYSWQPNGNSTGSIFGGPQTQGFQGVKGGGVNPASQGRNFSNSNSAVNNKNWSTGKSNPLGNIFRGY